MYTGNTFYIDEEQKEKIAEWEKTLPKCGPTAIGGRLTYKFTATSIGMCLTVEDCVSGKELDVTDYDSW